MDLPTTIMICSMFASNSTVNSMIINGSQDKPLAVTTVSAPGQPGVTKNDFKTVDDAVAYAKQQLASGLHVEIGEMQIPSGWLDTLNEEGITLEDLFYPCKNVSVATDLLNRSENYCASLTNVGVERDQCSLSFYKTADPNKGQAYAAQILNYAQANPFQLQSANQKINYNAYLQGSGFALPVPSFADNPKQAQESSDDNDDNDDTN